MPRRCSLAGRIEYTSGVQPRILLPIRRADRSTDPLLMMARGITRKLCKAIARSIHVGFHQDGPWTQGECGATAIL
jgi:hypothetical protein